MHPGISVWIPGCWWWMPGCWELLGWPSRAEVARELREDGRLSWVVYGAVKRCTFRMHFRAGGAFRSVFREGRVEYGFLLMLREVWGGFWVWEFNVSFEFLFESLCWDRFAFVLWLVSVWFEMNLRMDELFEILYNNYGFVEILRSFKILLMRLSEIISFVSQYRVPFLNEISLYCFLSLLCVE